MFKICLKYFIYVIQHKWYVFIECIKYKQYIHGIFHDLSKFSISEFLPYAFHFYGKDQGYKYWEIRKKFPMAWLHHIHKNKHHWNHWLLDKNPIEMPKKYIVQMIIDWEAMGKIFDDNAKEYYIKNKNRMILHNETIKHIKQLLELE